MAKLKIFRRTSLPEFINYNGSKYVYLCGKHAYTHNNDNKVIQVDVLSRRAKQATDIRGNDYKPSEFIFIKESEM